jgi:hypothetical protein
MKRFAASTALWMGGLTICWYDRRLPVLRNIKSSGGRLFSRLAIVLLPVSVLGMYFNISEKLRIDKLHARHYENYMTFMETGDESVFEE